MQYFNTNYVAGSIDLINKTFSLEYELTETPGQHTNRAAGKSLNNASINSVLHTHPLNNTTNTRASDKKTQHPLSN